MKGIGANQDSVKAMEWFGKAKLLGDDRAQDAIDEMIHNADNAAKNGGPIPAASIDIELPSGFCAPWKHLLKKIMSRRFPLWQKAASAGNPVAQFYMGLCLDEGLGIPRDLTGATSWFKKSAEGGNASAMNNLADHYREGKGVAQDEPLAISWYEKGATAGDPGALFNLGIVYGTGNGVVGRYHRHCQLVSTCRGQRAFARTTFNVGAAYFKGWGVEKDLAKAKTQVRKSGRCREQ